MAKQPPPLPGRRLDHNATPKPPALPPKTTRAREEQASSSKTRTSLYVVLGEGAKVPSKIERRLTEEERLEEEAKINGARAGIDEIVSTYIEADKGTRRQPPPLPIPPLRSLVDAGSGATTISTKELRDRALADLALPIAPKNISPSEEVVPEGGLFVGVSTDTSHYPSVEGSPKKSWLSKLASFFGR